MTSVILKNKHMFYKYGMEEKTMTNKKEENKPLTKKELKDLNLLGQFISLYCKSRHPEHQKTFYICKNPKIPPLTNSKLNFCTECRDLLDYAIERRIKCPLDPKPMCKKCPVHCYRKDLREKIKEIMKESGIAMIKRGRLDMIYHYFF